MLGFVLADAAWAAEPVTYYVSPTGRDTSSGRSTEAPWRTLARANTASFAPGDRLLLEGDASFAGPLTFGPDDGGSRAVPVTVGSYGPGRATVVGGPDRGVFVYNTAGLTIEDLEVKGPGPDRSQRNGILFYTDRPSGVLSGVTIRNVEVSRFGHAGVAVGSWDGRAGFRNVRIERVTSHGNGRAGIHSFAQGPRVHRDVRITRSRAYGNQGVPGLSTNSGSGLVLGGVERGRIDRSAAYDNGGRDTAVEGPVGIWTYNSNRVTIEHNRSYRNRTGGPADGGGFALDQNTSNSVLRFNVSRENDGAGYLSANGPSTSVHRGNAIRDNVSEDDGRRNGYGGIQVWRRSAGLRIERNRVTLSPTLSGSAAVFLYELPAATPAAPVTFRDNVFVTSGGAPLARLEASSPEGVRFRGNVYSTSGAPFLVFWNGARYGALGEWRAGTGQEAGVPVLRIVGPLTDLPEVNPHARLFASWRGFRLFLRPHAHRTSHVFSLRGTKWTPPASRFAVPTCAVVFPAARRHVPALYLFGGLPRSIPRDATTRPGECRQRSPTRRSMAARQSRAKRAATRCPLTGGGGEATAEPDDPSGCPRLGRRRALGRGDPAGSGAVAVSTAVLPPRG